MKRILPFKEFKKGKVRDIYDVGEHLLLIVTDRISFKAHPSGDEVYKNSTLTTASAPNGTNIITVSDPGGIVAGDTIAITQTSMGGTDETEIKTVQDVTGNIPQRIQHHVVSIVVQN